MKRLAGHLGRLLVLLVFLAAARLLYDRLKEYTFERIRKAIVAMPTRHIVAASLLTVLNYVIPSEDSMRRTLQEEGVR